MGISVVALSADVLAASETATITSTFSGTSSRKSRQAVQYTIGVTPMNLNIPSCCARAANGHAAAPPRTPRKFRRLMSAIRFGRQQRIGSVSLLIEAVTAFAQSRRDAPGLEVGSKASF